MITSLYKDEKQEEKRSGNNETNQVEKILDQRIKLGVRVCVRACRMDGA